MQKKNEIPASEAQLQLAWSRRYLKREKRMRLLRRVIPILVLAGLFAVGVYAATGGELPAWPTAAPGPTEPADPASTPSPASAAAPAADDVQLPDDLSPVQQASFTVT